MQLYPVNLKMTKLVSRALYIKIPDIISKQKLVSDNYNPIGRPKHSYEQNMKMSYLRSNDQKV